ncbi:MAG: hypothetical protein M1281_03195 [Chloroflexi bacterium]|nr:hypothetical protein [Chloroflexota bacterium]
MTNPIHLDVNPSQANAPQVTPVRQQSTVSGPSFAETLAKTQQIRFSNHAQKRLETRNISLSDDGISRLSKAVDKAQDRGGRESLVLVDDLAFIVNVKERLIVTAIDSQNRGEGVFTRIDSVVFADPSDSASAGVGSTLKSA